MFKLKRLELLGFKSFADRTRLEFGDDTVAVVGPNGCGKSNLSDAMNWVLGEQSARLLRGERMMDVIFSGTGLRSPTGMAEVSMTLEDPEVANADGAASVAFFSEGAPVTDASYNGNGATGTPSEAPNSESSIANPESRAPGLKHRAGIITVTRRLFRSGESEYLINGEPSRLRDIQDLFMGTGLGPESYAIIEQGRIGQILSSKPSDRRLILEEAAGVSKFKTRKRAAELKLESSRLNLSRITDILEEVTKQVSSLKRQASKARRFRELQEQLQGKQKITLASRLKALNSQCRALREEQNRLEAASSEAGRLLEEIEREQKAATLRSEEMEGRLTQLRDAAAAAELEKQRLASRIEQMRQQRESLEARAADGDAESRRLRERLALLEQQSAERARRSEELTRERAAAVEKVLRLAADQESLAARIRQSENTIEECREALLAAVSAAADLRNQLVQAEETVLSLERQDARLAAEKSVVEEEHRKLATELGAFVSENQRQEGELSSLGEAMERLTRHLEEARASEAAGRAALEAVRQEFSGATARKQALEESLARHAYSTESVRRLLTGEIPSNGHRFKPLGVLADFLEVASGYEEIVQEFLESELDCVVVEQHEEARSGISLLRSEGAGRSTFFVTHLPSNGHSNGHADDGVRNAPGVVAAVRELVSFEPRLGLNGDLPLASLGRAYVVEDAAAAERLAVAHPDCHFITSTGEHYHHRLVSGGRGQSAGPLALRRDFRELERRTRELATAAGSAEAEWREAHTRVSKLDEESHRVTAVQLESEKNLVLTSEKVRQTREAHGRAGERLGVLASEAAALAAERQSFEARKSGLRAKIEAASREKIRQEEESSRIAAEVRGLRDQFDAAAQEHTRAQTAAGTLEERARALESERARLGSEILEAHERLGQITAQIEAWRADEARLGGEIKTDSARLACLEAEQSVVRQEVQRLAEELQAARARRDEFAPRVEAARAEFESCREKRSEAEVAIARAESDRGHHAAQCREALHAEPEALLAELAPNGVLAGEALEAAEAEVREFRTRIENLGPLNMMALEELQEAEERFTFLESQRQDLLTSIEDTTQAIREIDRVSRQQFLEAFKAINENFAETFRTLFGGGAGELRLADESDPDSGLDVVAQPPGKRLQNVLLLSGGEKALAALALLIAIFRYTPSPFCVLDEVDAPLDESNVDRFTRLIREMSRHTQFILITHNKRTMEIAQTLYGVTMEEPGVSKLVSVKLEEAPAEPVVAAA